MVVLRTGSNINGFKIEVHGTATPNPSSKICTPNLASKSCTSQRSLDSIIPGHMATTFWNLEELPLSLLLFHFPSFFLCSFPHVGLSPLMFLSELPLQQCFLWHTFPFRILIYSWTAGRMCAYLLTICGLLNVVKFTSQPHVFMYHCFLLLHLEGTAVWLLIYMWFNITSGFSIVQAILVCWFQGTCSTYFHYQIYMKWLPQNLLVKFTSSRNLDFQHY